MDKLFKINFNGKVYYKGTEIAEHLGYVVGRKAILDHVDNANKITLKEISQYDRVMLANELKSIKSNIVLIDEMGVKALIIKSRLPNSLDVAKQLNIDISNHKVSFKEQSTINSIQKVFKNEKMEFQKEIDMYRTDLYFTDYKLCVECDEHHGHSLERKKYEDEERQKYIQETLKCKFIRFKPDDKDFDVLNVISDIFDHIKNFK